MADFQEKYEEIGDEVQFLMINSTDGGRETVDSALVFIDEKGYTFPVFFDTKMSATTAYGGYSLPTTYFIDSNGNVVAGASGALSKEKLQTGIDMITD
jgi:AhpC/TSA family.